MKAKIVMTMTKEEKELLIKDLLRYGYTKRTMLREIESISIGNGKPEWGAPTDKQVFIIKFKKGGEQ